MAKSKVTTLADEVMSSNLVVIHPEDTIRRAVELLTTHRLTALPVVERTGKLLGILSEKDILSSCPSMEDLPQGFLDQAIHFKSPVNTVSTKTPIEDVREILAGKSYRHIPVLDQAGKLAGIITRRDLIRILYLRSELTGSGVRP